MRTYEELETSMRKADELRDLLKKIEALIPKLFSFTEVGRLKRYALLARNNCFETRRAFNVEYDDPRHDKVRAETDFRQVHVLLEEVYFERGSAKEMAEKMESVRQILYRAKKIHKKFDTTVPPGLLTIGTTFKVSSSLMSSNWNKKHPVLTVMNIHSAGARHFMITCAETKESIHPGEEGQQRPIVLNSAHVEAIINHVPGKVVLKSGYLENMVGWMKERKFNTFIDGQHPKRGWYAFKTHDDMMIHLLSLVSDKASDDDVDLVQLFRYLAEQGVIKIVSEFNEERRLGSVIFIADKKRLRRAVKQNRNRFMVPKSKQRESERLEEIADAKMYALDFGY